MKKKLFAVCMAMLLALSLVACGGDEDSKEAGKEETGVEEESEEEADIELTLPASFFDEEGMADINEEAKASGVKEVIVNDDGSVTYRMNKEAHEKLLKEVKSSVDESIDGLLADKENYASYSEITYNEDVTEFKVMVDGASYSSFESFGSLVLYVSGNLYQAMNLVPEQDINTTVQFIDKDTMEVIESGTSKDLAEEYQSE